LGAAVGLHALQFCRLAISSARRGDRAHLLDAVLRGGAVGAHIGRVGALAALDRDRGRLCRRAGGDPSRRGQLHYLLIAAHRLAPAAVLSPFIYTEIVLVTALGFLVFGDVPNRFTLTGAAIVVASGLYLLHRERKVQGTQESAVSDF